MITKTAAEMALMGRNEAEVLDEITKSKPDAWVTRVSRAWKVCWHGICTTVNFDANGIITNCVIDD